jgi:hypothetical protein
MEAPIIITKNPDETWTVFYFGKPVGWIAKAKVKHRDGMSYRACSIHGRELRYCYSLKSAQNYLIESYC